MNNKTIYLAVTISLIIHTGFYFGWQQSKNSWLLAETPLKTGTSSKGLIEHLNLISKTQDVSVSKTQATRQNTPKTVAQKENKKINKMSKATDKIEIKPEQNEQRASATSSSSAEASQQITQKAKVEYAPPPISYPPEAIAQNAKGKVKVKALIDTDGTVKNVEILISSGYKILDEEAIAWFKKVKFSPALSANEKIASVVTQTISFDLNEATHNNS